MNAVLFLDPVNPTEQELRRWAALAGARYPMQDWDIIISADPGKDGLVLELAADPSCCHRRSFLGILYLIVGDAVRSKWNTRTQAAVVSIIEAAGRHSDSAIKLWAARSAELLQNPNQFDYKLWCDGGYARASGL